MGAITSANVANAIVKLVAADALPALMGNLVMGNLVNRDYEPTLAQAGDTVNVPIPPTLVANNIAEGGTVTAAESEPGQRADRAEHARGSDVPDSGRDQGAGGAGPAEAVHAAGGGGDGGEDRNRPAESVCDVHGERAGGNGRNGDHRSDGGFGGNGAVPGDGSGERGEVSGGESATYSALRQIPRFSEFKTAGEAGLRALVDGAVGKMKDFYIFRSQFVATDGQRVR